MSNFKTLNIKNKTLLMGILNVTPDSFSDGGDFMNTKSILKQVEYMIDNKVNIIDVGGESTRPGATFIKEIDEINRVIPVVKLIKKKFDILVSVDTYKTAVARAALIAGADIINDVQAGRYDGQMFELVTKYKVPYIAMHSIKFSKDVFILDELTSFSNSIIQTLTDMNYDIDMLYIDPGFGFSKTVEQNIDIIKNLNYISKLHKNTLLGVSRKSTLGVIHDEDNTYNRVTSTAIITYEAMKNNISIVRVHDLKENRHAIELASIL